MDIKIHFLNFLLFFPFFPSFVVEVLQTGINPVFSMTGVKIRFDLS